MSTRDTILARIRRRLGASPSDDSARRAAVSDRLRTHPAGLVPARGRLPDAERFDLFEKMILQAGATLTRVADPAAVPSAVADHLRSKNLPQRIRRGTDPRLAALPFAEKEPQMTVEVGPSDGNDLVGLGQAVAGIAESGTIAMVSGPENPTTLAFLPEHHVVVVRTEDVVADYETLWNTLRRTMGEGRMPHNVNLITGPSRSGDIEQTILFGAHGPRSLHILLVGDDHRSD
jgi:L-lactate dehydrogenase complex protein LldG